MTEEQAKQLDALADRSSASGACLQELDDFWLALTPVPLRPKVRVAMRLKRQFTPYLHAVADAFEECERRQSESDAGPTKIIVAVAAKFSVREKSLDKGWIGRTWSELNLLLQRRAAARDLHGPM
jgi:hypothetical protein